jgi:hypothetical protein
MPRTGPWGRRAGISGLRSSPTAFRLASFGPIFFLSADETKASPVFTDDAGTLDPFREPAKQLIKWLRVTKLDVHAVLVPSFPQKTRRAQPNKWPPLIPTLHYTTWDPGFPMRPGSQPAQSAQHRHRWE